MSDYGSTPPPPPPPPPPPSGGYQAPQGVATGAHASWILRVGAYLIDYALLLPFSIVLFIFIPKTVTTNLNGTISTSQSAGNAGLALLMNLIIVVIWVYNRAIMGGKGASVGKKALGLKLISEQTGEPIGAVKAFVRDFVHVVDSICMIGYLFPLWDQKRQTLADKIMTTVVTTKA